jgi:HlyD family secretion protein
MKRKIAGVLALVVLATLSVRAFFGSRSDDPAPFVTAAVTRGDIATVVSASGTVEAVTTVQVGTQVSGTIAALLVDYNSLVKSGQVLARLDQSTYASTVEQARASLAGAEADAERLRVAQQSADLALARARELADRQLIPAMDLQSAQVDSRSTAAQVAAADAKVVQARAAVTQAQVNLSKTVITSPIDGVVIARDVDLGQTVAASLQAPTLFTIAADLTQMRLNATIDESDVGEIHAGQPVSFTVDAYPADTFTGVVEQVRLNATVTQNVVTYSAMVSAPNPQLKLKPGMTANLTVEVSRRDGVLRVPTAALRFTPTAEMLARFGATRPDRAAAGAVVWRSEGGSLDAVQVRTGISDSSYTELVDAPLSDGAAVITQVKNAVAPRGATPARTSNPLLPSAGPPR